MILRFFFLVLLYIGTHNIPLSASNIVTDSLENVLLSMDDSPAKIDVLLALAQAYYTGEESMKHARDALRLAKEIGTEDQLGLAYGHVGWAYSSNFDIDVATHYADSALTILERIKSDKGLSWTYNFKALLFTNYEQYDLAEEYFQKALEAAERTGDTESQARVLNRWGVMYIRQGNGDRAFEKHSATLDLVKPLNNKILISRSLHNLGVSSLLQKNYKVAMDYVVESYQRRRQIAYYNGVAENMAKMAEIYFEVMKSKGDLSYYDQKLSSISYSSPFIMLEDMLGLPGAAENIGITRMALGMQIKGYAITGNYQKAFEIQNRLQKIENSITFSTANLEAMANQTIKAEKELVDAQNQIHQLQIDRTRRQNLFLSFGFLLIALVSFVIYRSRHKIRKLNEELHLKNLVIQQSLDEKEQLLQMEKKFAEAEVHKWKELNDYKNTLFGNITHEFRTPLTVILGLSNQLKSGINKHPKKALDTIIRNGQMVLHLVNQMLDLTKIQSGHLKTTVVQGDIMSFVTYLVESHQSHALSHQKNLSIYTHPDHFIMDYDPGSLQRIIGNLVSNALKFTPIYGKVQTLFTIEEANFQIVISDNGEGISEEDLPFIFDRFFQADKAQSRFGFGSGIGLSIVKQLVDIHKGTIEVESSMDEGTKFTVILPVSKKAPLESGSPQEIKNNIYSYSEEQIPQSVILNNPERVLSSSVPFKTLEKSSNSLPILLIIEDNKDVIDYIESCLLGSYNIFKARNGQEGIDQAIHLIPDMIISDVMMPEKTGFEVCQILKTDKKTSHVPIILLTAKSSQEDLITGISSGADAYLTKPFNREELLLRIQKLIEIRQTLQSAFQDGQITSKIENEFLDRLNEVIHENLEDEDFDINRLCRAMAMSRSQLHRKITALTGMSTSHYIKNIRLSEAMKLLKNTDLNVSEVAFQVGFKHANNFSTAFKAHFNVLPHETRN